IADDLCGDGRCRTPPRPLLAPEEVRVRQPLAGRAVVDDHGELRLGQPPRRESGRALVSIGELLGGLGCGSALTMSRLPGPPHPRATAVAIWADEMSRREWTTSSPSTMSSSGSRASVAARWHHVRSVR